MSFFCKEYAVRPWLTRADERTRTADLIALCDSGAASPPREGSGLGAGRNPVAQVVLYLLKAASLRLGHEELDEKRRHDADRCQYPEDR
jgi:hypothetical protein